jgi:hypothetical protein
MVTWAAGSDGVPLVLDELFASTSESVLYQYDQSELFVLKIINGCAYG